MRLTLLVAGLAVGCARPVYRVDVIELSALPYPFPRCSVLLVHTAEGELVALKTWAPGEDPGEGALVGLGRRWNVDRQPAAEGPQRVTASEVKMTECLAMEHAASTTPIVLAASVLSATVLFAVLAAP